MAYFMFFGSDAPDREAGRSRVREAHRAYIRVPQPGCRLVAGGALMDDAERMDGTLLVFEADDRAAVERFVAGDPYLKEGIFERTEIRRWAWGFGAPETPAPAA